MLGTSWLSLGRKCRDNLMEQIALENGPSGAEELTSGDPLTELRSQNSSSFPSSPVFNEPWRGSIRKCGDWKRLKPIAPSALGFCTLEGIDWITANRVVFSTNR